MSKKIETRVLAGAAVERKVKTTSAAAAVTTLVLYILSTYVFHADVPAPIAAVIAVVVPAAVTFLVGYVSKHTVRVTDGR